MTTSKPLAGALALTALPLLVLASQSPYKQELIQRIWPDTRCQPANIDETPLAGESAAGLSERLATDKARALSLPQAALFIGCDQVAAVDALWLGKPGNIDAARRQLQRCSGRCVEFHTAVAVYDNRDQRLEVARDVTRVHFRVLSDADIAAYTTLEPALDCAGSFKVEGLGISLFERVESEDPTALQGLPLLALLGLLRDFGHDVLQMRHTAD